MELFLGKVLVRNNNDRDELDQEREIKGWLQNKIVMLFFGSVDCERCRDFVPTLKDFFKRLMDEFYVERSEQLILLYVSLDRSEDKQDEFLKELPKTSCLFLPFKDPYRKKLREMFNVKELPSVVVLRPDCSVLSPNAVAEISSLGTACFRNWQEATDLIDRDFMMNEEFADPDIPSITAPLRKLKYKVEERKKKKRKTWWRRLFGGGTDYEEDEGEEVESEGGGDGGGNGRWG